MYFNVFKFTDKKLPLLLDKEINTYPHVDYYTSYKKSKASLWQILTDIENVDLLVMIYIFSSGLGKLFTGLSLPLRRVGTVPLRLTMTEYPSSHSLGYVHHVKMIIT